VPDGNLWAPAFAELTPWIFHAPRYQPARPAELVAELAAKLNIDAALISSTREGYKALAALRRDGLKWAADIVHSAAPEGHLDTAAKCDRLLDKHFAVGSVQAKALESAGVAVDKIVLAPNGVDVQGEFNPDCYRGKISAIRSELRLPESARVLTFVGRLSEEKDPLAFVQIAATAMASNERIFAVMAGDGPLRFAVEQAVRRLDVGDRFRIVGLTSRSAELLAAGDVFVLPSRVEGSPLTLLEAMSLERIVVAADVGAVREILRNGENGILISPPSVEGFNQALARLQRGEPFHEQYGRAARQTVVDGFDLRNTLGIYRSILLSAAQQARHERGMIS
jgi:glycosyltransferase involved in cell wall biosynthesis